MKGIIALALALLMVLPAGIGLVIWTTGPASASDASIALGAYPRDQSILLDWSFTGASPYEFKIYRSNVATSTGSVIASTSDTSYTDGNLALGALYFYFVEVDILGQTGGVIQVVPVWSNQACAVAYDASETLTATVNGDAVDLSWHFPQWNDPSSGQVAPQGDYTITRNDGYADQKWTTGGTTYQDKDVGPGKTYSYMVTANYNSGIQLSSGSEKVTFFTKPGAPSDLNSNPGDGQVELNWKAPSDDGGSAVTMYHLYWSETAEGFFATIDVKGTSYVHTGLENGKKYYYMVAAENQAGTGEPSGVIFATPMGTSVPSAPTDLKATAGDGEVKLTWKAPSSNGGSDITGYRIYWKNGINEKVEITDVQGTSHTFTLSNGVKYFFQVAAVNKGSGEGARSDEVSATPAAAAVPGAPTNIVSTPGDGKVKLTWKAPASDGGSAIDHYVVYQNGVAVTTVTGTTASITGLSNGVSYSFAISAHNAIGEGAKSKTVQVKTSDQVTVPSAPTDLVATPGSDQVQLSWGPPSSDGGADITGYKVYWGTAPSLQSNVLMASGTSYQHEGLTGGVTYYYKVTAVNQAGESGPSEVVKATLVDQTLLPSAPTDLEAGVSGETIELSWNEPTDDGGSPVTEYGVYRGLDSSNLTQIATVTDTAFVDSTSDSGVKYYYQVVAKNSNGMGPSSGVVTATVSTPGASASLPLEYVAVAGLGGAAAVGVISVLLLRKRRGP